MKRNRFYKQLIALLLLCACVAGGIVLWQSREEARLDAQLQEALALLDAHAGEYDAQKIVLPDTTRAEAEQLARLLDAQLRITADGSFATLTLQDGATIRDVYLLDACKGYIADMSPDFYAQAADLAPAPPQYPVSDREYDRQDYLDYLNMGRTWHSTQGSGITVAVIDTGIDTDHPEFAGRISEYSYNATQDKLVKDYNDWSLIEDEQGHGTAVTGVIAAAMDGSGTVGIAPEVNILVIKAECDALGQFLNSSDLVFGLYYAIERDVDVVNMSFSSPLNLFADATRLAVDSDIICVAAAGNNGTASLTYPAADPNVIGVGALAENSWELASYSNYGENADLVAPGTTYTSLPGGGYGNQTGSSLACPMVAGGIALYLSWHPYSRFEAVTERLYAACQDLGDPGKDWYYGYGALDISALVVEDTGTVTFCMLTDELEDLTQLFVRQHTLQNIPEPERLYAVFDGWYYDIDCTEPLTDYADIFSADLTLYAKWVNEDDGIPYTYAELDDGTIEIRSYTGKRRYITLPEYIDGKVVSAIGEEAFAHNKRLRGITLPAQLRHIRDRAFLGCTELLVVSIPDSVTHIGREAFCDTVRLSAVTFGADSRLQQIGDFAFRNCSSMLRFELPGTVTQLNGSAFCCAAGIRQFSIPGQSGSFAAVDGVLLDADQSAVVAYPAGRAGSYTLPGSVRHIGNYAFALAKLDSIDLEGVATVGASAFQGSRLEQLVLPDSVTHVGPLAFQGCRYLRQVQLSASMTSVPDWCFSLCSQLTAISIPAGITAVESAAFQGCPLQQVTFAPGSRLTAIGENAFAGCPVAELTFPAALELIGNGAFADCGNLAAVHFESGSALTDILDGAFSNCTALSQLQLPKGLLYIGSEAFSCTASLKTVEFPATLKTIDSVAFRDAGLQEVTLPASLELLGPGAFASCHDLQAFRVQKGNDRYLALNGVVYTADKKELVAYPAGSIAERYSVNSKTTRIGSHAFYGAWNLTAVSLPDKLNTIGSYGFFDCENISGYALPDSLEAIEEYAFSQNTSLWSIDIPDNVLQIGSFAFARNENLQQLRFTENARLPRISYAAFAHTGIQDFRVPASVSTMAQYAFLGCDSLQTVTFAAGSRLESISAYLFDGCTSLWSITFENSSALQSIQAHGFDGMTALSHVDLGDAAIQNIDNYAFRFCESLEQLTLPEGLTSIGRYAFFGCKALRRLDIPASAEHIGENAFLSTGELDLYFAAQTLPEYLDPLWDNGIRSYHVGVSHVVETADWRYAQLSTGGISLVAYLGSEAALDLNAQALGDVIVAIGSNTFAGSRITGLILPDSLTEIHSFALAYTPLESIHIPANVRFIGQYAFCATPLRQLTFAENSAIRTIEQYAFAGCQQLKQVAIPASLEVLGRYAFSQSGLEAVDLRACTLASLPEGAFMNTALTEVTLPDSLQLIGHNAFRDCARLRRVHFGTGQLQLMSNVFYNTGLSQVFIPDNLTHIGEFSFVGLKDLTEFQVSPTHPQYQAIDGLLYTRDGRKLICAPAGKTGQLTLPQSLEVLGFGAFENSSLTGITFHPDSNILTFGYRCFYQAAIRELTIPKTVISFDYYAFAMCRDLEKVTFAEGNQLYGIYEGAFYGCPKLQQITIPESIVEISDYAFCGCYALTRIPLADLSVMQFVSDYAFAYTGISEIQLPDTLLAIGDHAFRGSKLTEVTVPNDNQAYMTIGFGAFAECAQLREMTLPFLGGSFEGEDDGWFGYIFGAGSSNANDAYIPESLKTVTIAEGVRFVPAGCFYGIDSVEQVNLPHSIQAVGFFAFEYASFRYTLTNTITIHGDLTGHTLYSGSVGSNCYGTLVLSDEIKDITPYAFMDCNALEHVVLPSGLTEIPQSLFSSCDSLKSVVLPQGITSIGEYAFYECDSLERILLPEGVTQIGQRAFYGCDSLREVTIPAGITAIASQAFEGCSSLESLVLPEGLTAIASNAFADCVSLSSLSLPESLTFIDSCAFYNCSSLARLRIPDSVTEVGGGAFEGCTGLQYVSTGNGLTVLPGFHDCTALETVEVGTGITEVSLSDCHSLTRLTLPEGLTRLYLSRCTALTELDIPDSVTELSLQGCSSLPGVTLPAGMTEIGNYSFWGCSSLAELTIPQSITRIGEHAFAGCTSLTSVVIPEGVTQIGWEAFLNCTSLAEVTIPASVTDIGYNVFDGCTGLSRIYNNSALAWRLADFSDCALMLINADGSKQYRNSNNQTCIETPEGFVFTDGYWGYSLIAYVGAETTITLPADHNGQPYSCELISATAETVILPADATTSFSFQNCSRLQSISVPEGVTGISAVNCPALQTLSLPDSLEYLYLSDCPALQALSVPAKITDLSIYHCNSLQSLALSEELRYLRIEDLPALQTLSLPRSIQSLYVTECPSLQAFAIPEGLSALSISGNMGFTDFTLPETVADASFQGWTNLETVTLPESMTKIPSHFFSQCENLRQVTLPAGITSIGYYAFQNCKNLESILLPEGLTTINSNAFYGCASLKSITIPEGVTELESNVFTHCAALEQVSLPGTLTAIGERAFQYCDSLAELHLPAGVTEFGFLALAAHNGLAVYVEDVSQWYTGGSAPHFTAPYIYAGGQLVTELVLPEGLTAIDAMAFYGCTGLTDILLPQSLQTIGRDAFYGCAGLTEITLPSNLTEIGNNAFRGCGNLLTVYNNSTLPVMPYNSDYGEVAANACIVVDAAGNKQYRPPCGSGIYPYEVDADGFVFGKSPDGYLLQGYVGIEDTMTLPLTYQGQPYTIALNDLTSYGLGYLKHIIIPEGFTEIPEEAFVYCAELLSVQLPQSLQTIGANAFQNCQYLENVHIPDGVTTISPGAFGNCYRLANIQLPNSVTTIGEYAFYECTTLESIHIPAGVTALGAYAFERCYALAQVTGGEGLQTIGYMPFEDTPFFTDPANRQAGSLYLGDALIHVAEDATHASVPQVVAEGALRNCFMLRTVSLYTDAYEAIDNLSNLEVLVLYVTPIHGVRGCFRSENVPDTLQTVVLETGVEATWDMFSGISNVRIYTRADELGCGWDMAITYWHNGNPVYYSGQWINASFLDADGSFLSGGYYTTSQVVRQPFLQDTLEENILRRFIGWDLNGDGIVDPVPANAASDIAATAVYESHRLSDRQEAAPTCETDGYSRVICLDCGEVMDETVFPALGHSYETVTLEPTCTEDGSITHTCVNCGSSSAEVLPATGHSYGPWEVLTQPTEEASGLRQRTCAHCGHIEQEIMDPITVQPGDVNGDGRVNARDARALLRAIAGAEGADSIDPAAADFNSDGRVNARDARALLRAIAGMD